MKIKAKALKKTVFRGSNVEKGEVIEMSEINFTCLNAYDTFFEKIKVEQSEKVEIEQPKKKK